MKVIILKHNIKPLSQTRPNEPRPEVVMMTDSSLLKDGKPFFVPDFADKFMAHPYLVLRIGRLGKNIARQFAWRYLDGITLGFAVEAQGLHEQFADGGPGAVANAFDGAAILGDFMRPEKVLTDPFVVTINGKLCLQCPRVLIILSIESMIEYVSRYFTLKIGDLIYVCGVGPSIQLNMESTVTAAVNGNEVMHFKVK
ncbi:MAG: fumarylacetoacetate hydrolase family protein [Muribaculaceae bacterium]